MFTSSQTQEISYNRSREKNSIERKQEDLSMASKKMSDWPPPGWKVEVKRKNGRKYKCYINSKNHKKFYSKAAVLRYIGDECISNEQYQSVNEDVKKSSEKPRMHHVEANDIEWLPTGWILERRIRKSGNAAGSEYKCYIDPSTGAKFFSKPEVLRYLGSKECSTGSTRRKDRRTVDSPSALKSSLEPKVSQLSKACARKSVSSRKQKVVIERIMDQELPSGWIKETRIKMRGNKVVRRDSFFNDPASALVFRSKLEVLRYVETGEISKHAYRRRTGSIIEKDIASGKIRGTSSGKREETPKRMTRNQLFSGEASNRENIQTLTEGQGNENAGGKNSKRSSSRIRSAPSVASSLVENLPPKSTKYSEDTVDAKPLLENVSGTKKTVDTIKHTVPIVQDADAKYTSVKNSDRSPLSKGILLEENDPGAATIQRCSSSGKAQSSKRKTRHEKLSTVPSRSSKRLAGVDAEIVFQPTPIEYACRAINRNSPSSKSITSLVPACSELKEKHRTVGVQDWNKPTLRATCRKTSRTKPVPSLASVPRELQEQCWDADMQDVLAFQEEKNCIPTEFVLATKGQPSNKIDDISSQKENIETLEFDAEKVVTSQSEPLHKIDEFTSEEKKHHILDVKSEATFAALEPLEKLDDLSSPEVEHCTLDLHRENLIATKGELSSKMNDLRSEETKHCILDVNRETVLATPRESSSNKLDGLTPRRRNQCTLDVLATTGEPSKKIDNLTTNSPLLVDLNFLQLEQAPPGFSKDSVKLSSATVSQSLEHQTNNGQGSKVENTSRVQPIIEERPGSIQKEAEQPQSELCFSSPLWSDPCLEFAYKTLTGAIPFDDNLAIQDYIQHQLRTSDENNCNQLLPDVCAPSSNFRNDEAKMVSQLPEDTDFSTSNSFGSPEMKRVNKK